MPAAFELKVKEVIQRAYNVKSIRLEVKGEVDYKAGQFLLATLESAGEPKRYLSLSSSPTEKGHIEFTKKITQSDFSKSLDALRPGDKVKIQYPFGKFTLEDNPTEKIAFLSGGIGITPIRSICKYASDRALGLDIVLIYANHSIKDILFKEDFDLLQKEYPKLKVVHVLSQAEPGFRCAEGRINAQLIKENISDYLERKFYLCGPPAMVEAMQKILSQELNLTQENIIRENFQGY